MNIFLTGERGIGKTTLLRKLLAHTGCTVGGFYVSRDFKSDGSVVMFYMNDYISDERCIMADFRGNQRSVNKDVFDGFGTASLNRALKQKKIIVMDELGKLEENSPEFRQKVHSVLDADVLVLGVLKLCDGEFVTSIKQREDVLVFEVTRENRDTLEAVITPLLPHRQA